MSNIKLTWTNNNNFDGELEIYKDTSPLDLNALPSPLVAGLTQSTTEYTDTGADVLIDNYYVIAAKAFGLKKYIPEYHVPAWVPAVLFQGGQEGVWYNPADISSLFQDDAGSSPVTANNDPVGKMVDSSGNAYDATQAASGSKPLYNTDGTYHWFTFDKTDDSVSFTVPAGGWTGVMLVATDAGTAIYDATIPAGTYEVGGQYFPGTKIYGFVFREGSLTTLEKDTLLSFGTHVGGGNFANVTNANSFWEGWTELTDFPNIDLSGCYSFSYTWHGCTGLTSFPAIDTSSATYMGDTWSQCTGLTSFPMINTGNVTDMSWAWDGCTGLTSFPALNTSNVTDFKATWRNCDGLTSFPMIDTSSAVNLESAWDDCDNIASFPAIDTRNVTNFKYTWWGNKELTSFPAIDTSSGTNFYATWKLCSKLTSFPQLDLSSGTDFYQAWYQCYNLTDFPANMFDTTTASNFTDAFSDCSLTQQSVDNIVDSISKSGVVNGTLGIDGHLNAEPSYIGKKSIDKLFLNGWDVHTVGSYYSPAKLFANNEKGVWYDPSDEITLFQDSAGTTPVVSDGDPVGLMLDKSKGTKLGMELAVNGDFSNGLTSWTTYSAGAGGTVSSSLGGARFVSDGTSIQITQNLGTGWKRITYQILEQNSGNLKIGQADNDLTGGYQNVLAPMPSTVGTHSVTVYVTKPWIYFGRDGACDVVIDNISVKDIPGNHATQSTSAARPVYRRGDNRGVVNLLKWSEDITNAAWDKARVNVTTNATTAPNNTLTAEKIFEDGTSGNRFFTNNTTIESGVTYTQSIYAKASENNVIQIAPSTGFDIKYQNFDLSNGTLGSGDVFDADIIDVGNGWYRCSVTETATSNQPLGRMVFGLVKTPTSERLPTYQGDSISGLYVWGVQLEKSTTVSSYQRNDIHLGGIATGSDDDIRWLEFDGVDDFMITSQNTGISGGFSASAFVGYSSTYTGSDYPALFSQNTGAVNRGLSITLNANRFAFDVWSYRIRKNAPALNRYPHVIGFTKSPGTLSTTTTLYLDGETTTGTFEGSDSTPDLVNNVLQIGRLENNPSRYFTGNIYGMFLNDTALSQSQVDGVESYMMNKI